MTRMQYPGNPYTRLPLGSQLYCWIFKKQPLFVGHKPQLAIFPIFYPTLLDGSIGLGWPGHPWIPHFDGQFCCNNATRFIACCISSFGVFPQTEPADLAGVFFIGYGFTVRWRQKFVRGLHAPRYEGLPALDGSLLGQGDPLLIGVLGRTTPSEQKSREGSQYDRSHRHETKYQRSLHLYF